MEGLMLAPLDDADSVNNTAIEEHGGPHHREVLDNGFSAMLVCALFSVARIATRLSGDRPLTSLEVVFPPDLSLTAPVRC